MSQPDALTDQRAAAAEPNAPAPRVIYRPLALVMVAAAGLALVVGWWQPAAWLLALLLAAILAAVWLFAVVRLFRTGTWTASSASGTGPEPPAAA